MADEQLIRLETKVELFGKRLEAVEQWKSDQRTDSAVRAERDKHLDKRFDDVERGVSEIKGYLLKIVWVIVIGIIGSLLTFVIGGGLNAVP